MPGHLESIPEWSEFVVPSNWFEAEDYTELERLAHELKDRVTIDDLRTGVRIRTSSWVGVVRVGSVEIRIVPKLAGGNVGLARMLHLTTGLGGLSRIDARRFIETGGPSLFDLVALLLAEECGYILRGGLLRDYVLREEESTVVRGRILTERQMQRLGSAATISCRFDEHEQDVPENQLLSLALGKCLRRLTDFQVAGRVRRLLDVYREACNPDDLDLPAYKIGREYHRQNKHYKPAHELALLLLEGLGIDDLLAPAQTTRSFVFLIDMNRLFERFVLRMLQEVLAGSLWTVDYQAKLPGVVWDQGRGRPYGTPIPDFLVRQPPKRWPALPVDAKYKLYDERRLSPEDIYQGFVYAFAAGEPASGEPQPCMIVHPASKLAAGTRHLTVRHAAGRTLARLKVFSLPVQEALDEVENRREGTLTTSLGKIITELMAELELSATK